MGAGGGGCRAAQGVEKKKKTKGDRAGSEQQSGVVGSEDGRRVRLQKLGVSKAGFSSK